MDFFGPSAGRLTDGQISAYLEAVDDCSLDAVQRSCKQFREGRVEGRNNAFMPSPVELAVNARQWDTAIASLTASRELAKLERLVPYKIGTLPEPPAEPLGPIKVDFGQGMIDMSGMTFAEKEEVLRNKGRPADAEKIAADPTRPQIKRVRDA